MGDYLGFAGRIRRRTYWLHYLLPLTAANLVIGQVLGGTIAVTESGGISFGFGIGSAVAMLLSFALMWPGLAGAVKRCHDRDRSGWFLLVGLIPLVGFVWVLAELCLLRGTPGPNRFGDALADARGLAMAASAA